MVIRIKHTVVPQVFDDVEQKDCLFSPDLALNVITLDNFTRMNSGKFSIAGAGTESMPFGDVTVVKGYYIELQPNSETVALSAATLNVNALGARPFLPGTTAKPAKSFHEGGPITSLAVANLNASVVLEGRFCVWGDDT